MTLVLGSGSVAPVLLFIEPLCRSGAPLKAKVRMHQGDERRAIGRLPRRSSMPIPKVKPRAIASRLPFSQARFSRNTPAILMMARSASFSMNWLERWAGPSMHIANGDRTWTLKAE